MGHSIPLSNFSHLPHEESLFPVPPYKFSQSQNIFLWLPNTQANPHCFHEGFSVLSSFLGQGERGRNFLHISCSLVDDVVRRFMFFFFAYMALYHTT